MGVLSAQTLALANHYPADVFIDVSNQTLQAAGVVDLEGAGFPNDTYVELGIMHGGKTLAHRIVQLAADASGPHAIVSWTGRIDCDENTYLYARIRALAAYPFRLCAVTTRNRPGSAKEPPYAAPAL